jgi:hypothetical protein
MPTSLQVTPPPRTDLGLGANCRQRPEAAIGARTDPFLSFKARVRGYSLFTCI